MSKQDKKAKPARPKWVTAWCKEHAVALERYRDMVITVHREYGIVAVSHDISDAIIRSPHLKRSVFKKSCFVEVDETVLGPKPINMSELLADTAANTLPRMLAHEAPDVPVPEETDPPPPLAPPYDPFDNDLVIDGSRPEVGDVGTFNPTESLTQVAQRLGKKSTEVLMKVLAWPDDERPPGIHIHTQLTVEQVKKIEEEFKSFPSPDKQPPFMPRHSPSGGSVRLDGVSNPSARGSWGRSTRID